MKNNLEEIIKDTIEYTDKLIKVMDEATNSFYNGNDKEGLTFIHNISLGIDNVLKIYISFNEDKEEVINELNLKLNELVDGIENNDYILVADILNYEIKPFMLNIREEIEIIKN